MTPPDSLPAAPAPATPPRTGTGTPRRQRPPFIRPVRIGRDAGALAGIYQPVSEPRPETAVLICNPFGQEAIRAQRSLRVVSERLSRQGVPSLRFDYFGTGDSPGEDGSGHLTRWRQDILLADVHLRQLSGCRTTIWMGLRLGATLALQAAELIGDLPRPRRIILWEPVLDGGQYLGHLARMNEFWTRQRNVTSEALGFALTTRIRRHLEAIRPDGLPLPTGSVLDLLGTKDLPGRNTFVGHCRNHDAPLDDLLLESTVEWTSNTALDSQWVPDEAIAALLEICAQPDDTPAAEQPPRASHAHAATTGSKAPQRATQAAGTPTAAAAPDPGQVNVPRVVSPHQKPAGDSHASSRSAPSARPGNDTSPDVRASGTTSPSDTSPKQQAHARMEQPDSIPMG